MTYNGLPLRRLFFISNVKYQISNRFGGCAKVANFAASMRVRNKAISLSRPINIDTRNSGKVT